MRSGIKLLCLCSHRGELRLQMLKDETWAQKGIRSGRITGGNMSKLVLSNFQFSNADISSNMYLPVISQFFSQQSNHISSDICFSKKLRWPDENDIGGGILAAWEKINLTGLGKKNRPQVRWIWGEKIAFSCLQQEGERNFFSSHSWNLGPVF